MATKPTQSERVQERFGGQEVTLREIEAFLKVETASPLMTKMQKDGAAEKIARGLYCIASNSTPPSTPKLLRRPKATEKTDAEQSDSELSDVVAALWAKVEACERQAAKYRRAIEVLEALEADQPGDDLTS